MDDLTSDQLSDLRVALEALEQDLQAGLDGSAEAAKPVQLDQPAVGRVSRIDAVQQQKMLEANRSGQRARLQQVRSALRRFDDDEYGDCLSCGSCIGHARLNASPEAFLCIECQSARERR